MMVCFSCITSWRTFLYVEVYKIGATLVQFCSGAREKEGNASIPTALHDTRLNMHTAAWKQESQWNTCFQLWAKRLNLNIVSFLEWGQKKPEYYCACKQSMFFVISPKFLFHTNNFRFRDSKGKAPHTWTYTWKAWRRLVHEEQWRPIWWTHLFMLDRSRKRCW